MLAADEEPKLEEAVDKALREIPAVDALNQNH